MGETLSHQKKALRFEMKFISSSKRMAELMSYYDKPSELYFEIPEGARRKDLMGERFDYEAMIPPEPLTYEGRFIVTCLRCPRSTKRLYVIAYDLHSWPMRVIEHRGWFKDEVIYARPATDREMAEEAAATRHICYAADSWEEIVADEAKYGIDANRVRLVCTGRTYDPADDENTRKRIAQAAKEQSREERAFPVLAQAGLIKLAYLGGKKKAK